MSQSFARILIHAVFSTRNRARMIPAHLRPRLADYAGGILNGMDCPLIRAGAVSDHMHSLFLLNRTVCVAAAVKELKRGTSIWMKGQGSGLRQYAWQAGYGAFSVSPSRQAEVEDYIARQEEHHRTRTFQEEFLDFLRHSGMEYDERYIWD